MRSYSLEVMIFPPQEVFEIKSGVQPKIMRSYNANILSPASLAIGSLWGILCNALLPSCPILQWGGLFMQREVIG